ncbi:MAG: TetR/AcrR family transcriptional regulator [Anaerolineales bacterium]|nr:TetR/AcrR family transcriptional regulator [Anaerolineales bacterium]
MNTVESIKAVGLKLFTEKGYDAVGVAEVVEASSVTKPSLYHHFGSKRGLLDAILEDCIPPLNEELEIACDYQHDLPLSIQLTIQAFFIYARKNPDAYRLLLQVAQAPPSSEASKAADEYLQQQWNLIESMFKKAESDHGNMIGRSSLYTASFLGVITHSISLFLSEELVLEDELVYRLAHQFQHGIYS